MSGEAVKTLQERVDKDVVGGQICHHLLYGSLKKYEHYRSIHSVFSLGPFSIVGPPCLQYAYFFDVATKMIDVVTNPSQTKPTS